MSVLLPLALVLALASLTGLPSDARAESEPTEIGQYGFWRAYRLKQGDQAVCYMSLKANPVMAPDGKISKGKKTAGGGKAEKRGTVYVMITHRPAENATDVVSYTAGVKFKPASEAVLSAGAKTFSFFTKDDTAWTRDTATDRAAAEAIRNGSTLTFKGTSANGTAIDHTLNLKGSFAAYAAISKACGLPVPKAPKPPASDVRGNAKKNGVKKSGTKNSKPRS